MPIPKPSPRQERDDFIESCMSNPTMKQEFENDNQRLTVCNDSYNEKEFTSFEEKSTYDMKDVEIFSVGTWNGDSYTEKDLDDMVNSFEEIGKDIKPYVKLGHNKKQKMLQVDGMPAAGWIVNLKRKGEKLLADFSGIPKKIKELIEKKAYGRFSSEIYWNLNLNNKKHRRVLRAVALLGADTPAVSNLNDFINLYIEDKNDYQEIKEYHIIEEKMTSEEQEKMYDLNSKVHTHEVKLKEYELELKSKDEEIAKLKEEKEQAAIEQKRSEIKYYIDKKFDEGCVLPAHIEKYTKLAENDFESVKEILDSTPTLVDLNSIESQDVQPEKKYSQLDEDEKCEYVDKAVQEYIKGNQDVPYGEAYKIVLSNLEDK
ncbi:MAG TPA: hypothetical protein VMV86_01795 [Methanosarcinales archaeon]|nr:hypothetical protein [Methanosarcinales archaeon]